MNELKKILDSYNEKVDDAFIKFDYNVQNIIQNADEHIKLLNEFVELTDEHNKLIADHNMLLDSYSKLSARYLDLVVDKIKSKGNEND